MRLVSACLVVAVFATAKSESSSVGGPRRSVNVGAEEILWNAIRRQRNLCDADSLNNIKCENDALTFCGPNNEIMSIPCVVNGRQGFCNCEKTACVPEKPVCQDETSDCIQLNTKLPNNLDCHSYTYCNSAGKKLTLKCPGNLIFDPNVEKCMDQRTAKCNRIVCPRPGNMLQLVPFPQAKNYYVLCYKGMGDVRKCSDKYYSVRNNSCQFDCQLRKDSGLFRDTNLGRCKKGIYYACRRAGTNFTTVQAKCPPNMTFDEELGLCTETDNCTASTSQDTKYEK